MLLATNNTQAALGQIAQSAPKRKAEQNGAFADVLMSETDKGKKQGSQPVVSKSADKTQAPEDKAEKPEGNVNAETEPVLEPAPEEEAEVTGENVNMYLMQIPLQEAQPEVAIIPEAEQGEDLVILEGEAAPVGQPDPSAVLAEGTGEMARMPADTIPTVGMEQQDAEKAPQIIANADPSPLENEQKAFRPGAADDIEPILKPLAERVELAPAETDAETDSEPDLAQQQSRQAAAMPTPRFEALQNQEYRPPAVQQLPPQVAQSVMTQTIEAISMGVRDGARTMTIHMNPEFLGRMQMQLLMSEDGLTARIRTSDPAVQATIAAQLNQLQESLKEKGIQVVQVEVLLSTPDEQFMEQNSESAQQHQDGGGSRYARVGNVEAQITPLMPYGEDYQIENMNGSVNYTA